MKKGSISKGVYFITQGVITVHNNFSLSPFMVLGPGDFFGEFCFLDSYKNPYHYVCFKDSKCFFLKSDVFQHISREFDWEIIKLKLFAQRRVDYYNEVFYYLCLYRIREKFSLKTERVEPRQEILKF
jgi:hypothetical protein